MATVPIGVSRATGHDGHDHENTSKETLMAAPPVRQRLPHSRLYPLLHPLHALLLAFPIALFSSALASDITYLNSAEIQWTNFSQWLLAGGCLMGGFALLWAIVLAVTARGVERDGIERGGVERSRSGRGRAVLYLVLLAVMWIAGLVNSFQHSRDGWSSVETTGLVLSIISTLAALAAGWVGYSSLRAERAYLAEGEGL